METGRVRLRPITHSDYEFLRRAELDPAIVHRWRFQGHVPSPEEYLARLWQGSYAQFIVEQVGESRPIGLVSAYQYDPQHGWAYLAALRFSSGIVESAMTLEGLALFVDDLFKTAPIRRLYAQCVDYNVESFASLIRAEVLVEEGRLREHRYFAGRFWDEHIFVLTLDAWMRYRDSIRAVVGEW
jgi:RimJ/RimL family protein N-acetyltransferase